MKIRLLCVGKLREDYLRQAENEYRKRLRLSCHFEVVECKSEEKLLGAIDANDVVYALDERGEMITTREFAMLLAEEASTGRGRTVCFVIGGADGHSDAVRQRASRLLAFGRMTIAHRLLRIVAVEQIYRALSVNRGEPYHRD